MLHTRRSVLGALIAAAALSRVRPARGTETDSPDVVVVGAGAAGLAAARTLRRLGKSVLLLEANNRIGGRAFTETATFGTPYDHGAHWLHNGDANPFKAYGEGLRGTFDIRRSPDELTIYRGGQPVCSDDCPGFEDALALADEAMWEARYLDVSASTVVPAGGAWAPAVAFTLGPWDMAKPLAEFSVADWSCSADGPNYLCAQGYGALVAHAGRGEPVQLNTAVREIRETSGGVEVVTDRGAISALAVIVTVSTGVLASGAIRFAPDLPGETYAAFDTISMGLYNRIALKFSSDIFGNGPDAYALSLTAGSGLAPDMGITSNVNGSGLVYCDIGGDTARRLEREDDATAVAHAMDVLTATLGASAVASAYEGIAHVSRWGANPYTLGSYASADPGHFHMREALRTPVNDRIFFAGEACDLDQWATVAGAHTNGCETAANVARVLDGLAPLSLGSCEAIFEDAGPTRDAAALQALGCDAV